MATAPRLGLAADDVGTFVRTMRTMTAQSEGNLRQLAVKRDAADKRVELQSEKWKVAAPDLIDELRARDEELTVAAAELQAQIDALTHASTLLERERSKYVDLFVHAPDAYIVTDLADVTREANVAAGALFGAEPDFLVRRPLITFVARQDTRMFRTMLDSIREPADGTPSRSFTIRMRPRGQAVFVASVRALVVCAASGHATAIRWSLRRLEPGRVLAAGRRLSDLEFARTLAEDLREPLNAVYVWTGLLSKGELGSDEAKQAFSWIEKSAASQRAILDEMRELCELCEGLEVGQGQAVDLAEEVAKIVASVSRVIQKERFVVQRPATGVARARVDPEHLRRALELSLYRALDGTPRGGTIRVRSWVAVTESVVDIEAPEGARPPGRWDRRLAIASRLVEGWGGSLILREDTPSCRVALPRIGR